MGLAVDIGALRMPLFAVQPPPMEANPESDSLPECCLLRDILCADAGVSELKFNLLGIWGGQKFSLHTFGNFNYIKISLYLTSLSLNHVSNPQQLKKQFVFRRIVELGVMFEKHRTLLLAVTKLYEETSLVSDFF